jgi:dipeptidyl aminopeptidase/acylaminoacyl peptidase
MLIMQGTNDPRVPPSESEQIVAALEGSNTPVWYVLFDAEGHGFRRRANTDYDSAVTALFLQQYLLGETR